MEFKAVIKRVSIIFVVLLLIAFFTWKVDLNKSEGKIVYAYEPLIEGELCVRCMEIYIMNSDGGHKKQLTHNNFYDNMPKLSPDGKKVVFISDREEGGINQIYVLDIDGTGEKQLTFFTGNSTFPTWLSNAKIIFKSQGNTGILGKYRWMIMNADGTNIRGLDEYLGFYIPGTPYFSPDGSKILYTVTSGTGSSSQSQIWLINRDGSGKRQLTHGAWDGHPAWLPDGKKIIYSSRYIVNMGFAGPSPRFAIYVMDVDGKNVTQLTKDGTNPCWSPDGQKIVFEKYWGNGILVMDRDGGNKSWIAPKSNRDLTPSRTRRKVDQYSWPDWR